MSVKMRMPKLMESLSAPLQTDTKPYLLKPVPIGNRERLKLIGGTVAVNQLVQHGNFDATSGWQATRGTITATGNTLSFAITELSTGATQNRIQRVDIAPAEGHKCLVACTVNSPRTSNVLARWTTGGSNIINSAITANTWTTYQAIGQVPSGTLTPCFAVSVLADRGFVVGDVIQWRNVQIIDLTQTFGSTIADYAYTLEQGHAGDGIAWLKSFGFFAKDYYPYDAGSLLSVKTSGHKTVGFNQWDEVWELGVIQSDGTVTGSSRIVSKNFIDVIPNATYFISWGASVGAGRGAFYDAGKNFVAYISDLPAAVTLYGDRRGGTFVVPANAYYLKFNPNSAYGTTYNNDVCINLSSSKNGTYEPYKKNEYPLSDIELRGIPKLVSGAIEYDGDSYEADGTVTRRYCKVTVTGDDLNMNASQAKEGNLWRLLFKTSSALPTPPVSYTPIICDKYVSQPNYTAVNDTNMSIGINTSGQLLLRNDAFATVQNIKDGLNATPMTLVYELATPTTETADAYENPQTVETGGTESFIDGRTVEMPVGNVSEYCEAVKSVSIGMRMGKGLSVKMRMGGEL